MSLVQTVQLSYARHATILNTKMDRPKKLKKIYEIRMNTIDRSV